MDDVFSSEERSKIMKKVSSKRNKSTELRLIELFHEYRIHGWRRGYNVKGHPDFVFLDKRLAIFVDGCFWHGHDCRNTRPKQNFDYWEEKRRKNLQHDIETNLLFEARGWTVIRIWECSIKKTIPVEVLNALMMNNGNEKSGKKI